MHQAARRARPDIPGWGLILGALLILLFVERSVAAYFGGGRRTRLTAASARRTLCAWMRAHDGTSR